MYTLYNCMHILYNFIYIYINVYIHVYKLHVYKYDMQIYINQHVHIYIRDVLLYKDTVQEYTGIPKSCLHMDHADLCAEIDLAP